MGHPTGSDLHVVTIHYQPPRSRPPPTSHRRTNNNSKSFRAGNENNDSELSDSDYEPRAVQEFKSSRKVKPVDLPAEQEEILDDLQDDDDVLPKELLFTNIYTGPSRSFEARSLEPATTYQFRVCAVNSAGASDWSELSEATTPPSAPAPVSGVHLKDSTAASLTLAWTRPQSNGDHITYYNVEVGSSVISTQGPETYVHVQSLKPDNIYSIRVQAVNGVGPGPFSSTARLSTRPLPPAPPRCECINANHNSLKLKWGDTKSSNNNPLTSLSEPCQYTLEMENSRNQ